MMFSRKDIFAVFGLLGLLLFFYPDLFLARTAPLIGDHLEQHYPWAFQLACSLKDFKLPFWTPLIQCGFPLVAESQIGVFYLPNLILYGLLPFQIAYSYMNLLHWFIAGWGTYAYARRMNLEAMPSFVAAVVFVFGSAYGGAYYNMTSLKTICWFPVVLYFLERFLEERKGRFLFGMALVIGQSLVAGYLQMAVLTWLIFGVYILVRIFIFPEESVPWTKKALTLGMLAGTAVLALVIALPQIYLTFQLAMMSNRTGLEEGYAYVGSMSPMVLGTLVIPNLSLIFRGNNLYVGSFALFLILYALISPDMRKSQTLKLWVVMTLLALLLALGRWSPLYVAFIKITKFYSFRVPAKFLGFISFGLAMLSAAGFQVLWQGRSTQALIKKAFYFYLTIVAVFVALMGVGNLLLTAGKDIAMKLGEFFVMRFIYAKPGHPHSLETYLEGVKNYPGQVLRYLSFSDSANIRMIAMSVFCVALLAVFLRKKILTRFLLVVGILFLVVDLYAASFLDIRYDLASYKTTLVSSPILEALEREKTAGNVGRVYGFRSVGQRLPFVPGQNMLYGIEDIGIYSPLVPKRYYESLGLLGNVNDSNFQRSPSPEFALQRLPLLGFLNVSHVMSAQPLEHADLTLLDRDNQLGSYLYKNAEVHQQAYFISRVEVAETWDDLRVKLMAPQFDPKQTLLLEKEELKKIKSFELEAQKDSEATIRLQNRQENLEEWQVETTQAGFFVVSETFYPGWNVTVNDEPVAILKADGLFRAVRIDGPGIHKIQFCYKPFSKD
ncbi:MAG: hypothetical protein WC484_00340 [Candidatus Omnitrophota bacterium]